MSWQAFGQLAMILAVLVSVYPGVREQWARDRAGTIKTFRIFVIYMLYVACGLLVLLAAIGEGGTGDGAKVVAGTVFMMGWILYGASTLMKTVPRYRPLPDWLLEPFSIVDKVALTVILVTLIVLYA